VIDDQFAILDDVQAPGTQQGGAHVVDYEIQKLLSQGWQRYVAVIRERVPDIPAPVVREITTSFDAECHGGDSLRRGTRAISRSRRSYVLEVVLWTPVLGVAVAKSRVVMTGIDRTTGRAAEIPDAMLSAMELLEGRPILLSPPVQQQATAGR
jgi:acyl-CoA thioesterase FadM